MRGLSEIAVLYRTHRQAELFEYCFQKEGIPYTVAGREDYLADGEVRRALAFLRLLSDPADNLALRRLLGHPLPEDWTPAGSAEGLAARLEELPEGGALAEKLRGAAGDKPQALLEAWLEGQPVTGAARAAAERGGRCMTGRRIFCGTCLWAGKEMWPAVPDGSTLPTRCPS